MKITIGNKKGKQYTFKGKQHAYIDIDVTLAGGRLSIIGDIYRGSAGQCQDSIKELMINDDIDYREGWDKEKLFKLLEVWDRWHLNDMHPECTHQAMQGILEEARQDVEIYGYKLKSEVSSRQSNIKEGSIDKITKWYSVSLTKEEQKILSLDYSIKTLQPTAPEYYETAGNDSYWGNKTERRGWVDFGEFPSVGLLGKPCSVCGYKYGTSWNTVELPKEIVEYINTICKTS